MEQIPQEIQHQLAQLQQIQGQAQAMGNQKAQMEAQARETAKALEELEKMDPDTEVYKTIGGLLIRGEKETIQAELKEQKETLDLRVDRLTKQDEKIQKRMKELQENLQAKLGGMQGGTPNAG